MFPQKQIHLSLPAGVCGFYYPDLAKRGTGLAVCPHAHRSDTSNGYLRALLVGSAEQMERERLDTQSARSLQ